MRVDMILAPVIPNGMPERNRSAVGIQLLVDIDVELGANSQHLSRKGLVQLNDVDIPHRHARRRQDSPGRLDRPHPHDLRLDAGDGRPDDPRGGFRPSVRARVSDISSTAAAPSLSGHEFPAVTRPFSTNDGLSAASASIWSRTRALVLGHHGAVLALDGRQLTLEEARFLGGDRPAMRSERRGRPCQLD